MDADKKLECKEDEMICLLKFQHLKTLEQREVCTGNHASVIRRVQLLVALRGKVAVERIGLQEVKRRKGGKEERVRG